MGKFPISFSRDRFGWYSRGDEQVLQDVAAPTRKDERSRTVEIKCSNCATATSSLADGRDKLPKCHCSIAWSRCSQLSGKESDPIRPFSSFQLADKSASFLAEIEKVDTC